MKVRKTKLTNLLFLLIATCFINACSDSPKQQKKPSSVKSSHKEETAKSTKDQQQIRLTDCPAHALMGFYAQHGTLTETTTSLIGSYSDKEVEMKTVFHSCLPRTISIRSKTNKSSSFYRYNNGILITYDSIDPKGNHLYAYVERQRTNPSLPAHVVVDFNRLDAADSK